MIVFGSDHGGVALKDFLAQKLRSKNIVVEDLGTHIGNDATMKKQGQL